ncbi:replication protein A 70 kDa DNA-binding subunit C-like [Apium graveolens]|uniref:replication protein A 70 kDa DNA-binding subunit C-like n=1 Tax=Apium graveolens TaxID=4045 RepID=UPI003D7B80D4
MESAVFNLIEDLDQSTTNWKIKARVTRMWTSVSSENGSVKGYNVILLDDDNSHVHAFAYPNIWNGFKTPVIEGGVYVFDQFSVKDVVGNLKPVQADICIRFSQYTTVTAVEDDGMIPAYKFEFLDLGDLFAEASKYQPQQQPEFAIDVIGVIEDFEPLTKLDTKFGINQHKVSVWGDLAVLANNIYTKELQSPVIAIIMSTKVTTFMNTVQIGTLPSSKLYLNLDDESMTDMRMRLKEEGYLSKREKYLKAAKSEFVQTFMERMTLKDLNKKPTYDDLKVDEDVAWWFYSCNKCQQEVQRLDRRFRYNNCPRIIPVAPKRFRIMVLAEDDTFSCNVMLMDRASRRIVGTSAAKAYNNFEKAPEEGLPQVIKDLVGKEVTIIIQLNKANVIEDSTIFDANDIFDMTIRSPSPSESVHISESSSINFFVNSVDLDAIDHTPGSAKSVTKKIKKDYILVLVLDEK